MRRAVSWPGPLVRRGGSRPAARSARPLGPWIDVGGTPILVGRADTDAACAPRHRTMVGILAESATYGLKRSLSVMMYESGSGVEAAAHDNAGVEAKKRARIGGARPRAAPRLQRYERCGAFAEEEESDEEAAAVPAAAVAAAAAAAEVEETVHHDAHRPGGAAEARLAAVIEGSIALARSQLSHTACSSSCGVCGRGLGAEELALCLAILAKRVAALSRRCSTARSEIPGMAAFTSGLYERNWKLSFHASLKQIKLAIITKRRCPACRHAFNTADLGRALSFIDRNLESASTPSCRAHSACML